MHFHWTQPSITTETFPKDFIYTKRANYEPMGLILIYEIKLIAQNKNQCDRFERKNLQLTYPIMYHLTSERD